MFCCAHTADDRFFGGGTSSVSGDEAPLLISFSSVVGALTLGPCQVQVAPREKRLIAVGRGGRGLW